MINNRILKLRDKNYKRNRFLKLLGKLNHNLPLRLRVVRKRKNKTIILEQTELYNHIFRQRLQKCLKNEKLVYLMKECFVLANQNSLFLLLSKLTYQKGTIYQFQQHQM